MKKLGNIFLLGLSSILLCEAGYDGPATSHHISEYTAEDAVAIAFIGIDMTQPWTSVLSELPDLATPEVLNEARDRFNMDCTDFPSNVRSSHYRW
ncbi:hypothetical protein [Suicoccus acidiformans]|uniref:hypothetical protein n=1 Tax=Suicoccus acidiformans TaxID=2036206 RepID=UPI0013C30EEB|nr:hypothetical protein [Suicoccus acidiformans]